MGIRGSWLVVGLVGLALAGAWQYRDRLKARWQPVVATLAQATSSPPEDRPDVLYSWVDKDGVTHYEQQTGRGQRVEFDGSRITPLAPVDPGLADRVREAAGSDTTTASAATAEGEAAGAMPGGATGAADASASPPGGAAGGTLGRLRQELQVQARKMQQAKSSREDL